jgi:gas vesicle protein
MSDNNSDLGAFLAGFVIGGLVGAATALILAPQSGEETRGRLVDRTRDVRRSGEERLQDYRDRADSYTQDYRQRAGQIIDETRGRLGEASGQVQEQARIVLDAGKDRVSQMKEQVEARSQAADTPNGDAAGEAPEKDT